MTFAQINRDRAKRKPATLMDLEPGDIAIIAPPDGSRLRRVTITRTTPKFIIVEGQGTFRRDDGKQVAVAGQFSKPWRPDIMHVATPALRAKLTAQVRRDMEADRERADRERHQKKDHDRYFTIAAKAIRESETIDEAAATFGLFAERWSSGTWEQIIASKAAKR